MILPFDIEEILTSWGTVKRLASRNPTKSCCSAILKANRFPVQEIINAQVEISIAGNI
jgi:hypothetical protein